MLSSEHKSKTNFPLHANNFIEYTYSELFPENTKTLLFESDCIPNKTKQIPVIINENKKLLNDL